jgi:hypothetical protein
MDNFLSSNNKDGNGYYIDPHQEILIENIYLIVKKNLENFKIIIELDGKQYFTQCSTWKQ